MGGEERTVSVTGWMLGGGHSPVSRKLGLGVDNVVEMEMVLADLSVVVMNDNGMTITHENGTVSVCIITITFLLKQALRRTYENELVDVCQSQINKALMVDYWYF